MQIKEIIAKDLCQNHQKSLLKILHPLANEIEIQITEVSAGTTEVVAGVEAEAGAEVLEEEEGEVLVHEILQMSETQDAILMSLVATCIHKGKKVVLRKRIILVPIKMGKNRIQR